MDPRLLRYYSSELQHLRDVGGAFAKEFPKIAGRLGLDEFECADPYVERLLEGFAFLAARIQLKLDAEFPRFAQHLFEIIYPHYLAPTPSMTIVQFSPDHDAGSLTAGVAIDAGRALLSSHDAAEDTRCEYRTTQAVTLWPIDIVHAKYFSGGKLDGCGLSRSTAGKAVLHVQLQTRPGVTFAQLPLNALRVFLRGADQLPGLLYEELIGHCLGGVIKPPGMQPAWVVELGRDCLRRVGFDDAEPLFSDTPRSFSGYRLLHEYFAFPQRFMFVDIEGLHAGVERCTGNVLDVVLVLDRHQPVLERTITKEHLALFCTPGVNVFPKRCDRIHLSNQFWEHHVVPDRTKPTHYEVLQITGVEGFGSGTDVEQVFQPFYAASAATEHSQQRVYFQVRRAPRVVPAQRGRDDLRTSYVGSEVFLTLVDADEAPYRSSLRQLGVTALCSNRDLPITMPVGVGSSDFSVESGSPVASIRCLVGPSRPHCSFVGGDLDGGSGLTQGTIGWRFISHMALNYLSLCDQDRHQGAAALRELLRLYAVTGDAVTRRQIDGLRSVSCRRITRRIPAPGPIVYGRGLEVNVEFDHAAFEGTGVFLLGAVLESFFAQYASINAFTETVVRTGAHGEIMRWPVRIGRKQTL